MHYVPERCVMPPICRTACLGLVMFLAGCQSRLNVERSYRLESGTIQTIDLDPPKYDQKVTVNITTDGAVRAYVYLKKDAEAVDKDLSLKPKTDKALGEWTGDKSGTIEVTVPAHQIGIVRIETAAKVANVTVKAVGK